MPSAKHVEMHVQEYNKRAMAFNILANLLEKYELTKARKLNKFLGIKNAKSLLAGDLSEFDQDKLIFFTGRVIGQKLNENIND